MNSSVETQISQMVAAIDRQHPAITEDELLGTPYLQTPRRMRFSGPMVAGMAMTAVLLVGLGAFLFRDPTATPPVGSQPPEQTGTTAPPDVTQPPEQTGTTAPVPRQVSIALAFFDARNAYDAEAATALFTADVHSHGYFITNADMYPALFDWLGATGWHWTVDECHMKSGDINTVCSYRVENAWTRAIGLAPAQGAHAFEIWGRISAVPEFNVQHTDFPHERGAVAPNPQLAEAWVTVKEWIRVNHPAEADSMISPDSSAPVLDARSIDLWRLYTEGFVEFYNR